MGIIAIPQKNKWKDRTLGFIQALEEDNIKVWNVSTSDFSMKRLIIIQKINRWE